MDNPTESVSAWQWFLGTTTSHFSSKAMDNHTEPVAVERFEQPPDESLTPLILSSSIFCVGVSVLVQLYLIRFKAEHIFLAYLLTFLGALNQGFYAVSVSFLSPAMLWNEISFWTSLSKFLVALPICVLEHFENQKKESPESPPENTNDRPPGSGRPDSEAAQSDRWLSSAMLISFFMLTFRGVLSFLTGSISLNFAMDYLPISTVAAIDSTSGLFATLFGVVFLDEHVSNATLVFILVGLGGILIVLRPDGFFEGNHDGRSAMAVWAGFVVVFAAIGCGLQGILLRGWKWSVWLAVCTAGIVGVVLTLLVDHFILVTYDSCWDWTRKSFSVNPMETSLWLFVLCSTSFLKSLCTNWALKLDNAGAIETVYNCLVIAVQIFLQLLILGDPVAAASWVGMAVVVLSCIGILITRMQSAEPPIGIGQADLEEEPPPIPTPTEFLQAGEVLSAEVLSARSKPKLLILDSPRPQENHNLRHASHWLRGAVDPQGRHQFAAGGHREETSDHPAHPST